MLLRKTVQPKNLPFRLSHGLPTSLMAVILLSGCAGYHSSASAPEAAIALSSANFNFSAVALGQTVTQTLHISNSGKAPLQITNLALSAKQFVISGPSVPRVVLPNMALSYTLAFTPTVAGTDSADLTIHSNAVNSVASVSLTGVGQKVIASLEIAPASLNFGNLPLQTTTSKNVTLRNAGETSVTLSGITVVGAGFGYSDLSPGFSLSPNQAVTFQVWFRPTVKGPASGTLSVLSPSLASPASVAVAGDGVSSGTTPPTGAPPAQHSVHLAWNASGSVIAGYRVYRSQSSSGGFQPITSSLVPSTDYDDATVDSGATYYYSVTDVTSSGEESAHSNEATAVIPTP